MKLLHKSIAYFCLLALTSLSIYAGNHEFNTSIIKTLNIDYSNYPILKQDVILLYGAQILANNPDDIIPKMTLFEGDKPCVIKSLSNYTGTLKYDLNLFLDLEYIAQEELESIHTVLLSLQTFEKSFLKIRLFISTNGSISELPYKDIIRRKVESKIIEPLTVTMALDFISQNKTSLFETNNILWFVTKSIKSEELNRLEDIYKDNIPNSLNWLILLCKKETNLGKHPKVANITLLTEPITTDYDVLQQKIYYSLSKAYQGIYTIEYEVPDVRSLEKVRPYHISVLEGDNLKQKNKSAKLSYSYNISFPDSVIRNSIANLYLRLSAEYQKSNLFLTALDTLYAGYKLVYSNEISDRALDIIREYASSIVKKNVENDYQQLFQRAENDWKVSTNEKWYKELKYKLFNAQLDMFSQTENTLTERIDLWELIRALYPDNINYVSNINGLKGDFHYNKSEFWQALEYYSKSLNAKFQKTISEKRNMSLREAIISDYRNINYLQLFQNASPYLSLIENNFDLRAMYAKSSYEIGDFSVAADQYEWLLFNWNRNQNIIQWDKAFDHLQQIYLLAFRFDDAYKLNKRLFRQNADDNILKICLVNLRAKYLLSVAKIFPVFWERVQSEKHRDLFFQNNLLTMWPHYLKGVYVLSVNGAIIYSVGEKKNFILPSNQKIISVSYPSLTYDNAQKVNWMINRINGNYIVFQFSDELSDQEMLILSDIRIKKMSDEPWQRLQSHVQNASTRSIIELISGILKCELAAKSSLNISRYWAQLKSSEYISYMVYHGLDGKIIQNESYNRDLGKYDEEYYPKSSRALAYMYREISYDNREAVDVVTPIYIDKTWKAAIRFGIKKQY